MGTRARQTLAPRVFDRFVQMRLPVSEVATFLGAALGYYACAVIGTLLSVPPSGFAIIWPATAFLISVLLIVPPKRWILCVAGVVPTHLYLAATLQPHAPLVVVVTQVTGNVGLAFSTVVAIHKTIGKRPLFDTLTSLITFIAVAGIAVPAIGNALILSVHVATGWVNDWQISWGQWMIAGLFPTITIPPVLVLVSTGRLTGQPEAPSSYQELLAVVALLFGASLIVFGASFNAAHWPALFLAPFPLLLWAAVRLGVGGTCLALLTLALAIVVNALREHGPFALQSPIEEIVSLQVFLVTTSIPLILLAALMDERRRAATVLHQSEARMNVAASATDTGLWQWDATSRKLWMTKNCRAMFNLNDAAELSPYSFLEAVHPEDRAGMEDAITAALISSDARVAEDYRVGSGDGMRWLLMHTHSEFDKAGKVHVSGVFRDVTDSVLAQLEADQLRARLARLREDERRRIAEDLHDSTTQHLVAARLNISILKSKMRSEATRDCLAQAMKSLQEASMEIRSISYLLHPPHLGKFGLCDVLQQYVSGFESRTGVTTSMRVNSIADRLPLEQQQAILRITQESLANVHRHAKATHVSIRIRCISGNVHLVVSDDGKGIASPEAQHLGARLNYGVGIPGMRARVGHLNGRIDINGGARGTTVHVAIPLAIGFSTH